MKKINDPQLLTKYIRQNNLQLICGFNIEGIAELCHFDKKEFILRCDVKSNYLYFLLEGEIKIFSYTLSSHILCRNFCSDLTLLGEAASLWGNYPTNNVQTLTSCTCICIDLRKYRELLLNDVIFLRFISRTLASRITNDMASRLLDPLEIQLSSFILSVSSDNIFTFNLTECANILNTSYRHLLRILKEFCDKGYLKKDNRRYIILDRSSLEEIADGIK